jgi:hypothetical protein
MTERYEINNGIHKEVKEMDISKHIFYIGYFSISRQRIGLKSNIYMLMPVYMGMSHNYLGMT